jgi:hypothetical protein
LERGVRGKVTESDAVASATVFAGELFRGGHCRDRDRISIDSTADFGLLSRQSVELGKRVLVAAIECIEPTPDPKGVLRALRHAGSSAVGGGAVYRRQVNIELTTKGAAVRKSAKDARSIWLAHAIAQLDERERETLFAAAEIIQRLGIMTSRERDERGPASCGVRFLAQLAWVAIVNSTHSTMRSTTSLPTERNNRAFNET